MSSIPRSVSADDPLAETYLVLAETLATLEATTQWMLNRMDSQLEDVIAGATPYLELLGITIGGWLMARRSQVAMSCDHSDIIRVVNESNFFAVEVMARSAGLVRPILAGASQLDIPIGGGTY